MIRTAATISASLLALAAAQASAQDAPAAAPAAAALDAQQDDDNQVSEIIVTATRQATNMQQTPIAITAVTAETLQERSLATTADLASIVPNATFRPAQGAFGKAVTAFIRGIGQSDSNLASEPGVAYYIDDVYYPLLFGSQFDLLDLDHIEVLRGPQGTLFGRNALAGAVVMVSKQPDLRDVSAYGEVTTGAYHRVDLRAGLNLPLSDTMAITVSGVSKKRGGYQQRLDFRCQMIKNGTPELAGKFPFSEGLLVNAANFTPDTCEVGSLGGEDMRAMRGSFLWKPSSRVSLTITGDYTRDESENAPDTLVAVDAARANSNANLKAITDYFTAPGGPAFAYDGRFITGDPYKTYATFGDPIAAGTVVPGSSFYNGSVVRGGFRYPATSPTVNWGISSKLVLGLTDQIDLIGVAGYRRYDTVFAFDVDGSPLPLETTRNNTGQMGFNGEVRLSGKMNWADWVVGGFFYAGKGYVHTTLVSAYNNLMRYQNHRYHPVSKAVYANVTLRPMDKLDIVLGGRYSDDKKEVNYRNLQDANAAGNIVFDVTPGDKRFDWKAGVNWHAMDHVMLYASAATGFRLPSFNSRPLQVTQVAQIPGDEIQTYEIGVKSDLLDRRLRLNLTGFYTDYKTRPTSVSGQEYRLDSTTASGFASGNQVTAPLPGGPSGSTTCRDRTPAEISGGTPGYTCIGRTYYTNTPGEVWGVEGEIEARPIDNLSIDASFGYSKFTSADIRARPVNARQNSPFWTGSAGIQYKVEASAIAGSITPRLDWFYTGSQVYSTTSTKYNQPAYSVFNGRVTYNNTDHGFSIAAGATNLFNKFYWLNYFVYQDLGYPNVEAQPSRPREWFVQVSKRF